MGLVVEMVEDICKVQDAVFDACTAEERARAD